MEDGGAQCSAQVLEAFASSQTVITSQCHSRKGGWKMSGGGRKQKHPSQVWLQDSLVGQHASYVSDSKSKAGGMFFSFRNHQEEKPL